MDFTQIGLSSYVQGADFPNWSYDGSVQDFPFMPLKSTSTFLARITFM